MNNNGRLLIVSNRLPLNLEKKRGKLQFLSSSGGLATGVRSVSQSLKTEWIGWPGCFTSDPGERLTIQSELQRENLYPVFLSKEDIEQYYEGFSNNTLWPLFHYFPHLVIHEQKFWDSYKRVNEIFIEAVLDRIQPGDSIWIHDYQLLLLPEMIRKKIPDASIGFFLHIPFPSFEVYRLLPWRKEILSGMLGADLIGFHTFDYARHFLSSAERLLGLENFFGKIQYNERRIQVNVFPMGIDYRKFSDTARSVEVEEEIKKLEQNLATFQIVLSVDRLDYTKGILQRLQGFRLFLQTYPQYHGEIVFVLQVVPSRTRVEDYIQLKKKIDQQVGRINGEFGRIGWTPIIYYYRPLPFHSLVALYRLADICLLTPFRDGMNLVAKEYIASQIDGKGVLILSELTGASEELGEAIRINPNHIEEIAQAIHTALQLPETDRIARIRHMQVILSRYDVFRWAADFSEKLKEMRLEHNKESVFELTLRSRKRLLKRFQESASKLLLLDYDGTLVPFAPLPEEAKPDPDLYGILKKLCRIPGLETVIISGRNREQLHQWFHCLPLTLIAEHGGWLRENQGDWREMEPSDQEWKSEIRPILEQYIDKTPGAMIEEKYFSLVWHYRRSERRLGELRARELIATLGYLTANLDLHVVEGSKVVEIKSSHISKGRAARYLLKKQKWDLVIALGDDQTDEDTFRALRSITWTIKVGNGPTLARYILPSYREVRVLLDNLIRRNTK